ncbi:MAG TPA: hypothetical protein VGR20_04255 [Acidimicrobiia bacterium]|nr:hypothetical protein [Acidimicrobiia bacterium]
MTKLVATWHSSTPADVDLRGDLGAAELLALARERLIAIPDLQEAVALVGAALAEVSAWFDTGLEPVPARPAGLRVGTSGG